MNILWNDPPIPGENGEDGVTEFVARCTTHGKAANMVYRKRGPRGAILKDYVIGCSKECGEAASGGRKAPKPMPPPPQENERPDSIEGPLEYGYCQVCGVYECLEHYVDDELPQL